MNDYFQNDITVGLDLETHRTILSKMFGKRISNSDYDTRLIHNQRNPECLQLMIYYKQSDYLFEKFELLKGKGICVLSIIKQKNTKHVWEFPDIFDFSQSTLISIQASPQWEHNKKAVVLIIDNVDILVNERYVGDGRFKLTTNIFQHLDKYIRYGGIGMHSDNDKFIEENHNKETYFGPIKFILSFAHCFEQNYSTQNINILRDAYITLTDESESLTDNQIIELGKSLCLLMSFYWEKPIDFFIAKIRINDVDNYRTRERLKFSEHNLDNSQDFLLLTSFKTFYDFIESIDYEKYDTNSRILHELIPRILKARKVDDISAFMILYNIIEKIRNYFLSHPFGKKQFTIKEEFDFKLSKRRTSEFIKNKIKEIKEIVVESDLAEFDIKATDKVNFIKKTGLIDQFNNLLTYLELDVKSYKINFLNLIKIRNEIYHGKIPQEDIRPYIEQMTILIYDMILKMTNK